MSENPTTSIRHVDYDGYVLRFGFGRIKTHFVMQGGVMVGMAIVPFKDADRMDDSLPIQDGDTQLDPGGVLLLFDKPENVDGMIKVLEFMRGNMAHDRQAASEETT